MRSVLAGLWKQARTREAVDVAGLCDDRRRKPGLIYWWRVNECPRVVRFVVTGSMNLRDESFLMCAGDVCGTIERIPGRRRATAQTRLPGALQRRRFPQLRGQAPHQSG